MREGEEKKGLERSFGGVGEASGDEISGERTREQSPFEKRPFEKRTRAGAADIPECSEGYERGGPGGWVNGVPGVEVRLAAGVFGEFLARLRWSLARLRRVFGAAQAGL
jgi:hypothetical protein